MKRDQALHALSHQHQHGLALAVIVNRGLDRDASDATVADFARKALVAWDVELNGHFQVEERELFPQAREVIAEPALVDELLAEHRELEELIERLRRAPSRELLRAFAQALSAHIRSEERRLFEQLQQALGADAMAALGVRLDAAVSRTCPVTAGLPWEPK